MTASQATSKSTQGNGPAVQDIVKNVVIRLAGDSGDGMQLTGTEFTRSSAMAGNDVATFPDFPAEIRAPAGTLAGVSGFQLHFAAEEIYTPGDAPDVLVAMNPAAFKKNIGDLKPGGLCIANSAGFTKMNLQKVGYESNPLEDEVLTERFRIVAVDMQGHVARALEAFDITVKEIGRSKNFWALGLLYWLYNRETGPQVEWIRRKFQKRPPFDDVNVAAFKAGHAFGETAELFGETYQVKPAKMPAGRYRNIMGNQSLCMGLVAAGQQAKLPLFLGSYPITPASDILHTMARYRNYDVITFQAEDEIAAIGAAIGASYGGAVGICSTSGPGLALKAEALGLAHILELPLVVVNVQRGGPSTGLPTKTEQADLLQCMYGRNGEAPLPILAANSPADCFEVAFEAVRIAVKYMTPVVLLSDGFVANGAEPWRIPDAKGLPTIDHQFRTDPEGYQVYGRDATTLARDWVRPGTAGLEHRVGGLEKDFLTGDVSYDPENHEKMVNVRREKVQRITQDIPPLEVDGPTDADVLMVGWGGTYGALKATRDRMAASGKKVAHLHLRWLNPFPTDLHDTLKKAKNVLVCELNKGQLAHLLRAEYLVDAKSYTKVQGQPFTTTELEAAVDKLLT